MSRDERFTAKKGGRVAFVAGCRAPFVRTGGMLDDLTTLDLARGIARELTERAEIGEELIERTIVGTGALGFSMVVEIE